MTPSADKAAKINSLPPDLVQKASRIAREAGARLREFYAQGVETEYKGDVDLVTVADRTAEKLIRELLAEAFPEHGIYGEEGTRDRMGGAYRWYVDPLDGTTNFAHGFPHFAVSMGLEHRDPAYLEHRDPAYFDHRGGKLAADQDGKLVAGVIYDPMRDELFTAERGRGAQLNGKPIHSSRAQTIGESLLATGFPSRKRHSNPNIHFYHEFTLRSHGVRRAGSAALDLAYVACGRLDAFWEFNLNPWDTTAGILLVEEAGGRVTDFAGKHYRLDSREILASNGLIHDDLIALFRDMFAGKDLAPIASPRQYAESREQGSKAAREQGKTKD